MKFWTSCERCIKYRFLSNREPTNRFSGQSHLNCKFIAAYKGGSRHRNGYGIWGICKNRMYKVGDIFTQSCRFITILPSPGRKLHHKDFCLGSIFSMGKETETAVYLDSNSLTMHTFVTGSTGSGKSNTVDHFLSKIRMFNNREPTNRFSGQSHLNCKFIAAYKGRYRQQNIYERSYPRFFW